MKILGLNVKWPTFSINRAGENFYDIKSFKDWNSGGTNMELSMNHPILSPAMLFVSKLFSQAQFKIIRDSTGKEIKNSPYIKLLKNPNATQTMGDLLEALLFTEIANGVGVIYKKTNILTGDTNALYVLDFTLIEFPDSLNKNNFVSRSAQEKYLETEVIYDQHNENIKIKLKDLMFFYDLPNVGFQNPFMAESRITGLRQTLINTQDSLIAKNIILKSNGKELISGIKEGFPLTPTEKESIEKSYANNYGMSFDRRRGIVVSASVTHKSLHIALRDLGLDESVKTDGNIVYTAMHIPKDILSLEAKKTTYNNFKESMSSYIQNEMQSTLDGFCAMINKMLIEDGVTLIGDYEHLPIMQYVLIERYQGVLKRAEALVKLRESGLPDEICLELVGLDENIKMGPLIKSTKINNDDDGDGVAQEDKIRKLINQAV